VDFRPQQHPHFTHLKSADPHFTPMDKYWSNQDVMFDFSADLTGTGSVPICT